jgi:hypothetical protein
MSKLELSFLLLDNRKRSCILSQIICQANQTVLSWNEINRNLILDCFVEFIKHSGLLDAYPFVEMPQS